MIIRDKRIFFCHEDSQRNQTTQRKYTLLQYIYSFSLSLCFIKIIIIACSKLYAIKVIN